MKLECCCPSYISTVNGRPEILGVLIRHSERLSSVLCFIRSSLQRLPKSKLHIDTTECLATRSHLHMGHRGGRAQEPDSAAGAKEGQGESRAITVVVWPNEGRQGGNTTRRWAVSAAWGSMKCLWERAAAPAQLCPRDQICNDSAKHMPESLPTPATIEVVSGCFGPN